MPLYSCRVCGRQPAASERINNLPSCSYQGHPIPGCIALWSFKFLVTDQPQAHAPNALFVKFILQQVFVADTNIATLPIAFLTVDPIDSYEVDREARTHELVQLVSNNLKGSKKQMSMCTRKAITGHHDDFAMTILGADTFTSITFTQPRGIEQLHESYPFCRQENGPDIVWLKEIPISHIELSLELDPMQPKGM